MGNKLNYPLPKPHTKPVYVCFESKHSEIKLPIEGFVEDNEHSFEIFYQWILRLGYFPMVEGDIKKGEVVVIINPKKEWTPKDISQIKDYLDLGGKILLMDSPDNATSTANSLLSAFDVRINHQEKIESSHLYAQPFNKYYPLGVLASPITNQRQSAIKVLASPITNQRPKTEDQEGWQPIFFANTGEVIGVKLQQGKGTLVVLSFSDRFTDAKMGVVESNIPDEELREVYQLEFDIIEGLVRYEVESRE